MGAAAGASARLFTTPIGNVVTRKQTASLLTGTSPGSSSPAARPSSSSSSSSQRLPEPSIGEVLRVIRAEKGLAGLWAGYGATLVLTLNPSITFYLQHALKKALSDRRGGASESGAVTFLTAALSKVVATAVTYPFNIAKARLQVSAPESPRPGSARGEEKSLAGEVKDDVLAAERSVVEAGRSRSPAGSIGRRVQSLMGETIFATVVRLARTEGVGSLYDGISGELLKAFFNHGTTMLSKDIAHGLIVRLYFFVLALVANSPAARALLSGAGRMRMSKNLGDEISGKYTDAKGALLRTALVVTIIQWAKKGTAITR